MNSSGNGSDDKNTDIINAARDIFADYGYKKVTMEDIAQKLNITRSALYYYYKNKEDLFKTVIKHELALYDDEIHESLRQKETIEDKLVTFGCCTFNLRKKFINMYKFTIVDFVECFKTAKDLRDHVVSLHMGCIMQILKNDRDLAGVPDLESMASLLAKSLRGIFSKSPEMQDDQLISDIITMCRIFYRGLRSLSLEKVK